MVAQTLSATRLAVRKWWPERVAWEWLWGVLPSGMLTVCSFARLWRRPRSSNVELAEIRYSGKPVLPGGGGFARYLGLS